MLLVVAGDSGEDELVGLLVEQEHGRGLGAEDRPRNLDDRAQQPAELLLRREHARGNSGLVTAGGVAHPAATFAEVR